MEKSLGHSVLASTAVRHLAGIAALSAFVVLSPVKAMAADPVDFGDAPSFVSEQSAGFARSDDKHAFTIDFGALELGLGTGPIESPVVTRTFSMAIPVSAADKGAEIPFHFQGYSFCEEGVNAYAVFSINGQTSTINFAAGHDQSFVHSMVFKAPYAVTDVRLTVLLAIERDAKHRSAQGYMNVSQVDSETNPVPAKPRIPDTIEALKKKQ